MKNRWTSLLLVLALACGGPSSDEAEPNVALAAPAPSRAAPERVETQRIEAAQLRATIAASGTIEARRITEVGSEVPGRIVAVLVDVGDRVEADAPLFRIDPGPYRMALTEAEAGLALARAESANAQAEAARLKLLLEQNAASQQRYEQLRTQAEVARAQVAQMEARLEKARRDLAQTEVRAPYAASVVERRAHEGAMAGQAPILVLQESRRARGAPERAGSHAGGGAPDDAVRLFVEGLPDPIEATVSSVSQRVDPGTRTYEVRADVVDASGQLKAGSYARAELHVSRGEPRPVVHRSAVLTRDGRSFVLKVEDGVVRYAPVRVGVSDGEQIELLSGARPARSWCAVRRRPASRTAHTSRSPRMARRPRMSWRGPGREPRGDLHPPPGLRRHADPRSGRARVDLARPPRAQARPRHRLPVRDGGDRAARRVAGDGRARGHPGSRGAGQLHRGHPQPLLDVVGGALAPPPRVQPRLRHRRQDPGGAGQGRARAAAAARRRRRPGRPEVRPHVRGLPHRGARRAARPARALGLRRERGEGAPRARVGRGRHQRDRRAQARDPHLARPAAAHGLRALDRRRRGHAAPRERRARERPHRGRRARVVRHHAGQGDRAWTSSARSSSPNGAGAPSSCATWPSSKTAWPSRRASRA